MCLDPLTWTIIGAGASIAGAGVSYQQGQQALKSAKTRSRQQIAMGELTRQKAELRRQQGILQQQKQQEQLAGKQERERKRMLAYYNLSTGGGQTQPTSSGLLGTSSLFGGKKLLGA